MVDYPPNIIVQIEKRMNTEYKGIKISEDTKFENMDFVHMISVCLIYLRLYLNMSISVIAYSIKQSARIQGSGGAFLMTVLFQE